MLFNDLGRVIPSDDCRVFANAERDFYKLNTCNFDYGMQHPNALRLNLINKKFDLSKINEINGEIRTAIEASKEYQKALKGPSISFAMSLDFLPDDVGEQLEDCLLPLLKTTFEESSEGAWFKATIQGNNQLKKSLQVAPGTGYQEFLAAVKRTAVVGVYFPTALQEYDIPSQRRQLKRLPPLDNYEICISGHLETIYSILMYPNLLNHPSKYSPILTASSLIHSDDRMVPLFKSYGPHFEFWLLSQMMTADQTQVSEQWAGGITIYTTLDEQA